MKENKISFHALDSESAQLAGHESLDTTRRYINPDINDMRKAVQSISNKK